MHLQESTLECVLPQPAHLVKLSSCKSQPTQTVVFQILPEDKKTLTSWNMKDNFSVSLGLDLNKDDDILEIFVATGNITL